MHPRRLTPLHTGRQTATGSKGRSVQRKAPRGGPGERGRGDKRPSMCGEAPVAASRASDTGMHIQIRPSCAI